MSTNQQPDLVTEARELLSKITPDWRMEQSADTDICTIVVGDGRWKQFDHHLPDNARLIIRAPRLLRQLADEVERLQKQVKQMIQDARDDAQSAANEARWSERQGEDYGSY